MPPKYRVVRENGVTFYFKREPEFPDLLHIYVRHLTTIDDALDTFFDAPAVWNPLHARFENYGETLGLYWAWIDEAERKVMVITCFKF